MDKSKMVTELMEYVEEIRSQAANVSVKEALPIAATVQHAAYLKNDVGEEAPKDTSKKK